MSSFVIKDSGERKQFESGMVRDTEEGKTFWSLVASGPMLRRWADHLTNGARKYDKNNWMKAAGEEELQRFKESAFRHFMQWYYGDADEDHAAAVIFNLNGAEYVKEKLANEPTPRDQSPRNGPEPIQGSYLHSLADRFFSWRDK